MKKYTPIFYTILVSLFFILTCYSSFYPYKWHSEVYLNYIPKDFKPIEFDLKTGEISSENTINKKAADYVPTYGFLMYKLYNFCKYWGATIGAASGFAGGFVGGTGNAWKGGSSFGDGLVSGLQSGTIGAVTGGLIGGAVGGIQAHKSGLDFWKGDRIINESIFNETYGLSTACEDCGFQDGDLLSDFKADLSGSDDYRQLMKSYAKAKHYIQSGKNVEIGDLINL